MPTVADMGMVWMGSGPATSDIPMGMMANDHGDMMLDHENIYYTPSHHSMSSQSMDDMNTIHSSSHLTVRKNCSLKINRLSIRAYFLF